MAFDQSTRNRLQKFVSDARKLLSEEFTKQMQNTYGLDPNTGTVAKIDDLPGLNPSERQTAKLLRDTLDHYLAAAHKANPYQDKALIIATLDRIVREQAFTVLNRLAALRMAESRQFVMESISKGYQSKGFQLYQRIAGSSLGETGQAYQVYLFSIFDELSLDLAVLFDRFSIQGRLFPRETIFIELLELINDAELEQLWGEDETVGWIYQYFNSKEERKKMRDESQAPRNSRELAVRNQFFTPRYVVEFLTDNTLGRIWYEMTKGQTSLTESCEYLVRRPNEEFLALGALVPTNGNDQNLTQEEQLQQTLYVEHRPLKDPRDIRMLDPACGSMHFGLYAFDLFEKIYQEAWELEVSNSLGSFAREVIDGEIRRALHQDYESEEAFLADIPRLIIENNIHGVDIDPRAAQVAGLSLWLRAQKSWAENQVKPYQRPQISRSNIVCAEPMPGETAMLKEFTEQVQPPVLGQLVETVFERMQLAGEAGSLLKIEQEIQTAIEAAKKEYSKDQLWQQSVLMPAGDSNTNVDEQFWLNAEQNILAELESYAETTLTSGSSQKRLFAADACKGFAFIDLCRKRFDVVLMNPPFGEFSKHWKDAGKKSYPNSYNDILSAFVERGLLLQPKYGRLGAITSRTCFYLTSFKKWRENITLGMAKPVLMADLGNGIMDAAMVEAAAYVLEKQ
ncbi:Eco57I restriction-modification methylase domain-containing protein [Vibrio sp.]|uniref:Eco57I restriction-modification methylase domain-containing protein n=1 Tax=Vibrio sp. TaxID=678 RepID=UPI003F6D8595